ncbi:NAD-dependent epimerase/dehydratase family protein [Sporichthya polymorpha]|uniref:NAD-dependent epimerase/dehydratase family protein n=1 Tax=Sporichthya polymorpha TaxID=35751 RepID=UPI00036E7AE2|nr:SDR family NAD(P)-dependent oxidoreductase [Sporichthya polymorpha]
MLNTSGPQGTSATRALVTGANGFVGHHVVAQLVDRGCGVIAVSRQDRADPAIADLIDAYVSCDVADLEQVRSLPLGDVGAVINLAGLAAVGPSFDQSEEYLRVNVDVLDTLCTALSDQKLDDVRVIAVSSGAVYRAGQSMPLSEEGAVDPGSSPYAASKIAMEERALAHRTNGLDCVVVRPFNHIGPGQSRGFLVPDLAHSAAEARRAGRPMRVGTLTTRRDYTDVRDVARAYIELAEAPTLPDAVYNVCSGASVSGEEILAMVLDALGWDDLPTESDPSRVRPTDNPDVVGDNRRLARATGWAPTIPVRRSIEEFVSALPGELP